MLFSAKTDKEKTYVQDRQYAMPIQSCTDTSARSSIAVFIESKNTVLNFVTVRYSLHKCSERILLTMTLRRWSIWRLR